MINFLFCPKLKISDYEDLPNESIYFITGFEVDRDSIIYGPFDYSTMTNHDELEKHRRNILSLMKNSNSKDLKQNLIAVSMKLEINSHDILKDLGYENVETLNSQEAEKICQSILN